MVADSAQARADDSEGGAPPTNVTSISPQVDWGSPLWWPGPDDPLAVAERLVSHFKRTGAPLRCIDNELLGYSKKDRYWRTLTERQLRNTVYMTLKGKPYVLFRREAGQLIPEPENWKPKQAKVTEVLDALMAVIPSDKPNKYGWFVDRDDKVIPCRNGLVNIKTRKLTFKLTPKYFNRYVLACDYNPKASSDIWQYFQRTSLMGDAEKIRLAKQWGGYVLSGRVDLHKYLLIIGRERSGKETLMDLLSAFLPPDAHCELDAYGYIRERFSEAKLLGRSLINVSDSRSKLGDERFVELILRIVGQSDFSIRPPYGREFVNGKLPGRINVATNKTPPFSDDSKALVSRTVVLKMNNSYVGKEIRDLLEQLTTPDSLSAILNDFLDGLHDLEQSAAFFQPEDGAEVIATIGEIGSPKRHFIAENVDLDPDGSADKKRTWDKWVSFADQYKYPVGTYGQFCADLYAASDGKVTDGRPREATGKQRHKFLGMRLRVSSKEVHGGDAP